MDSFKQTISITFGDQAENHVGMQKLGSPVDEGFTVQDLENIAESVNKGYVTEITYLNKYLPRELQEDNEAAILIIRNGVKLFDVDPNKVFHEHLNLDHDKKAKMKGRVVNKHARYNLCYDDTSQEPNYEEGKGRVVAFSSVPLLNTIKNGMKDIFGKKSKNLVAELNLYYDLKKCGIGFHGDTERKIVICLRLGASMPLEYQWFYKTEAVYERIRFTLNHGDIYLMSEKATGNDWKKRNIYTLRHAAGCKKYLTI